MGYYRFDGTFVPEGDSYFEVVNGTFGAELRPKADYLPGFYRAMANTPDFWQYFGATAPANLPDVAVLPTRGKSIWIGGDSLHNYAGGDGKTTAGFVTDWNRHLGADVINAGYAGSKWAETTGGGGIKRITDLVAAGKAYDVFVLAWGTNDDAGGNGTIEDAPSNAEGCTMAAAMKWCITQLRTAFPKSAVGLIIPPPKNTNDGMKDRGDLMIEVCRLLHVPYVDMRERLTVADLQADGVHLAPGGANKYGAAEAELILRICPYGEVLAE
jgi:lysophospholipase L1-like esterase